jgi:hypothetical protein
MIEAPSRTLEIKEGQLSGVLDDPESNLGMVIAQGIVNTFTEF